MPRTEGKNLHLVTDIWVPYAEAKLKADPALKSRTRNKVKHYTIFYVVEDKEIEITSYPRFRKVVEHYFNKAQKAIIYGECINITSNVGKIVGKRVERDFRKAKQRKINWKRTKEQPLVWSDEKQRMVYSKVIYYTSKEWCRIGWEKNNALTNEKLYEFVPAGGANITRIAFKTDFIRANQENALLKYQYLYNPIVRKTKAS